MILFTNLKDVRINNKKYPTVSVLKLTTEKEFKIAKLNKAQIETLNLLKKEAKINNFQIKLN